MISVRGNLLRTGDGDFLQITLVAMMQGCLSWSQLQEVSLLAVFLKEAAKAMVSPWTSCAVLSKEKWEVNAIENATKSKFVILKDEHWLIAIYLHLKSADALECSNPADDANGCNKIDSATVMQHEMSTQLKQIATTTTLLLLNLLKLVQRATWM